MHFWAYFPRKFLVRTFIYREIVYKYCDFFTKILYVKLISFLWFFVLPTLRLISKLSTNIFYRKISVVFADLIKKKCCHFYMRKIFIQNFVSDTSCWFFFIMKKNYRVFSRNSFATIFAFRTFFCIFFFIFFSIICSNFFPVIFIATLKIFSFYFYYYKKRNYRKFLFAIFIYISRFLYKTMNEEIPCFSYYHFFCRDITAIFPWQFL